MVTSKKMNLGPTKKTSPIIKRNIKSGLKEDLSYMKTGAKMAGDILIPKSASDLAWTVAGGKAFSLGARAVGGITKKGAKFVGKIYRNMGR